MGPRLCVARPAGNAGRDDRSGPGRSRRSHGRGGCNDRQGTSFRAKAYWRSPKPHSLSLRSRNDQHVVEKSSATICLIGAAFRELGPALPRRASSPFLMPFEDAVAKDVDPIFLLRCRLFRSLCNRSRWRIPLPTQAVPGTFKLILVKFYTQ